jgi:hypothetical protein
MRLFNRKSQLQRLLETLNDSLDASTSGIKSRLPSGGDSAKTLKAGLIAAGSLAGLSRERRHLFAQAPRRGARDDS